LSREKIQPGQGLVIAVSCLLLANRLYDVHIIDVSIFSSYCKKTPSEIEQVMYIVFNRIIDQLYNPNEHHYLLRFLRANPSVINKKIKPSSYIKLLDHTINKLHFRKWKPDQLAQGVIDILNNHKHRHSAHLIELQYELNKIIKTIPLIGLKSTAVSTNV
jgi:hypothetical protein